MLIFFDRGIFFFLEHTTSIEIYIFVCRSGSLVSKQIGINFDFFFWLLLFFLLIVLLLFFLLFIGVLTTPFTLLLFAFVVGSPLSGSAALLVTIIFLIKNGIVGGIIIVLKQVWVVLEERPTRHEVHLSLVFATFGLLSGDSLLQFLLFALGAICLPLHEGLERDRGETVRGQGSPLLFNFLLKRHLIITVLILAVRRLVPIQHVPLRKHMSVLTIIAAIGAHPVESIQAFLDSFQEVAARDDRVGHFAEFCAWVTVKINRHIPLVL